MSTFELSIGVQTTLTAAIKQFLDLTARVTPRWFNKPKFHILLHLPEHVCCSGPAILFATETFESFNALIRDHSVHSNRQAPSRDIGLGFAYANRIRHLTSGGKFRFSVIEKRDPADGHDINSAEKDHFTVIRDDFRTIGPDALHFIKSNQQLRKYIGIPDSVSNNCGRGIVAVSAVRLCFC